VELLHTLVAVHSEVFNFYPWSIYAFYMHRSSYFCSMIFEIVFMLSLYCYVGFSCVKATLP
jgi:hypothetical protein